MSANKKRLDRYVERYNAGDLDGVMELYADDSVQGMPDGVFEGRAAIRERLSNELEAIPDVTVYAAPGEAVSLRSLTAEGTTLFLFYLFDWSGT